MEAVFSPKSSVTSIESLGVTSHKIKNYMHSVQVHTDIKRVCTKHGCANTIYLYVGLIRRTACARAQFSGCSSTTNAHSETGQMAVSCQNLPLGALSIRSAPLVLVG
jgi:uncharacterized integral membrane protein